MLQAVPDLEESKRRVIDRESDPSDQKPEIRSAMDHKTFEAT